MQTNKFIPWATGILAVAGAVSMMRSPGKLRGLDVEDFGRLAVLDGGRIKPIDSIARNSLLVIRGKQTYTACTHFSLECMKNNRTIQADEWLLDVLFRPEVSESQAIFTIDDPEVLGLMGIQQSADRYFSFKSIAPYIGEIEKQAMQARGIEGKLRTRFQSAIVNLYERLILFHRLRNTVQLASGAPLEAEIAARNGPQSQERQQSLIELAAFRPLPDGKSGDWKSVGEALRASRTGPVDPGLEAWARIAAGYAASDPGEFNAGVSQALKLDEAAQPSSIAQTSHEIVFNRAQPFYVGMVVYVFALLAIFASWATRPKLFQPAAFGLLCGGALIHTVGLASRIIIQGRPPVTNLYSSAVFVGWAAVILGVILEKMYKKGYGTAVAAASGFASLIVAHHLASDGDTMEMMRAVLDSNFWLGTHVVTITIGYSGTFLAGAIALAWTFRRHFGRGHDVTAEQVKAAAKAGKGPAVSDESKTLVSMAYGVICFALFFSFVGTVLGGIWADQSWGRFWGWDPKENGALLIVLWNAIILHARWGGYARERGQMAMAIFGNVITSLSWFGVNMLGVGLHSYGFMDSAFVALSTFIGSQLACIALCLAPPKFWRGRAAAPTAKPAATPSGA